MISINQSKEFLHTVFDVKNNKPSSAGQAISFINDFIANNELDNEALSFMQNVLNSIAKNNPDTNKVWT
jgi:Mg2+/Co2+ transporter CorC